MLSWAEIEKKFYNLGACLFPEEEIMLVFDIDNQGFPWLRILSPSLPKVCLGLSNDNLESPIGLSRETNRTLKNCVENYFLVGLYRYFWKQIAYANFVLLWSILYLRKLFHISCSLHVEVVFIII